MLLAIDPGAAAGWALFEGKRLAACGLDIFTHCPLVDRVVIERPHSAKTKAPVRDVITLAIRAGEWGGRLRELLGVEPEYVEPATWKGSTPKDISHARTWAKLSPDERVVLAKAGEGVAPSKRHNVVDAVGLALWAVGR
jgi:hypothetical protein